MATKTLEPWLNDFIVHEVTALVQWRRSIPTDPNIKQESVLEGVDFSHDHSNIRSYHPTASTAGRRLQLLEVLSGGDVVTAYASDGQTRIGVRFFEDAVATLEAEMEEKLVPGVKGDVFRLERFSTVCTHMGPSDGFVQLEIEQVNYDFTLRKIVGSPTPIEDRVAIQTLITEIGGIWNKEHPLMIDSDDDDDGLPPSIEVKQETVPARVESQIVQTPRRKKRTIAQLHSPYSGVEVGVNLAPPLQASMEPPTTLPLTRPTKPVEKDHLLHLLGNRSRRAPQPPVLSQLGSEPATVSQIIPSELDVPMRGSTPPTLSEHEHAATRTKERDNELESSDPRQTFTLTPTPASSVPVSAEQTYHTAPDETADEEKPYHLQRKLRIPRVQRKIPEDQMKLLNDASSWFPSLPGQQFPIPNVPVELLRQWHHDSTPSHDPANDTTTSQEITKGKGKMQGTALSSQPLSSEASASASDTSDGEFTESQWPPSSPPSRPDLPPDSSMVIADNDDLEMSVPQPLTIRPRALDTTTTPRQRLQRGASSSRLSLQSSRPPSSSSQSSTQSPTRSHKTNSDSGRNDRQKSLHTSPQLSPHTSSLREKAIGSESSQRQVSLKRDAQHEINHESPLQSRPGEFPMIRSSVPTPSPRISTIPPSPRKGVSKDPALGWHAHRTAWFRRPQRRDWLQNSYIPDPNAKIHLSTILVRYHSACTNDQNSTADDLLSVIPEAFPHEHNIHPGMTFRKRLHPPPPRPSRPPPDPNTAAGSPRPPDQSQPSSPNMPPPAPRADVPMQDEEQAGTHPDDPTPPSRQPFNSSASSHPTTPRLGGGGGGGSGQPRTHDRSKSSTLSVPAPTPPHHPLPSSHGRDSDIVPIFATFYENWMSSAPGGAFAVSRGRHDDPGRGERRRVDVLTWDV